MDLLDFLNYPLLTKHTKEFQQADPFPHIVLDHFVKTDVVDELMVPQPDSRWYLYSNAFEYKYATDRMDVIPDKTCVFLMLLNSALFINFLEKLTGIQGLIGDPWLRGGGLHVIPPEGFLHIHKDFQKHPKLGLYRRLNLLLYLNESWDPSWGGELELWDEEMKHKVKTIEPNFNRCVIFDTAGDHFHGHPDPLKCPKSRSRNSLAVYYYTAAPPPGVAIDNKSTQFKARPGDPSTPEIEELRERRNGGRLSTNVKEEPKS